MASKLALGIAVTVIPLGIAVAAIMGFFGATSPTGLVPEVRPDHQTPAVTVLKVEIKSVNGVDKLLNTAGDPNGDFLSCPACTLRLVITNNGAGTHNIVVTETGASSGSIAPGETKSIDIVSRTAGMLTYESEGKSDQIQGMVKILKVSG